MSGLKSRRKGMGYEYEIRDLFREMGWKANRVPSSGAAEGFKDDLVVTDADGFEFRIECKRRKQEFKTIYELYEKEAKEVLAVNFDKRLLVHVSREFTAIYRPMNFIYARDEREYTGKFKQACRKILGLSRYAKTTPYLALRDDGKYTLFVRVI